MAERAAAEEQLARVLEILPRAARAGGVGLAELAAATGVQEKDILRDLQEVYTRSFYHPAGGGDDVSVIIEADQVEVWTTGEFKRPTRLNGREAFALSLGLRVLAADSPEGARPELYALASRLESLLASATETIPEETVAIDAGRTPEGVRALLTEAVRERQRCEIGYLKPGAAEPELRALDPYALLAAGGRWYLVGRCHRNQDVRTFRVDRTASVSTFPERFELPPDFNPADYVADGRVYRADETVEVVVRYSASIARWVVERGPVEEEADGSVLVRYRVSDPLWLVSHVLQHGADAEVIEPVEMREAVGEALRRALGDSGG